MEVVRKYSLTPMVVPKIKTRNRRITTRIPVPESIPILNKLAKYEPISMAGQPPVVVNKAKGFNIYDKWNNKWIDWSSGVLITNVGHGHPDIIKAIGRVLKRPLLATYVFPHELRGQLAQLLVGLAPNPNYRAFVLSTGGEAVENCIKLAKTYGYEKHGPDKRYIVSFQNAFHGRTLGAQLAGGRGKPANWIGESDKSFVKIPFPDGYKNEDIRFDLFLETLNSLGIKSAHVCGVISESFQGVGPDFFPKAYIKKLETWCRENDILLIIDEVQSGFGRTGRMFMFEHYEIVPDLIACGKGISSSLPISAVLGREDVMNLYPPSSMTSTHSGSPLPVAAAIASISLLQNGSILENVRRLDPILRKGLQSIRDSFADIAGCVQSLGLVGGIQIRKPGTKNEPDSDFAFQVVEGCFRKGLLMFSPVGIANECVKIAPPLSITESALNEGFQILLETFKEVKSSK